MEEVIIIINNRLIGTKENCKWTLRNLEKNIKLDITSRTVSHVLDIILDDQKEGIIGNTEQILEILFISAITEIEKGPINNEEENN